MMRRPSRVPTSCSPLEVVRSRKSTGTTASSGVGQRQARPGVMRTRVGLPNRVTTSASPEGTCTKLAAARTNRTKTAAGDEPQRQSRGGFRAMIVMGVIAVVMRLPMGMVIM